MFGQNLKQLADKEQLEHMRFCSIGYWSLAKFTLPSDNQYPIRMASFYKESGHK